MTAPQMLDAVKTGDLPLVRRLLDESPDLAMARDERGTSATLLAMYHGQDAVRDLLVERGAPLSLHEAAAAGREERARELLDADASAVSSFSADGFTPLHFAVFFGHEAVARLLVSRGADVHAVAANPMAVQPIHSAAARRDAESAERLVRLLLDAGADPNVRQHGGWTPLQQAAAHGNVPLVKLLLERGADTTAAADDGRTALAMATAGGHAEAAAMLERHAPKG